MNNQSTSGIKDSVSTIGRINLGFGSIVLTIIAIIVIAAGIKTKNPFLVVGGLLYGVLCYWL